MAGTDAKQQTPDDNAIPTRRRSRWWLPVLTFVAGIAVGVLLVGLLGTSTPDFSALQSAPTSDAVTCGPASSRRGWCTSQCRLRSSDQRSPGRRHDLREVGPALSAVNLQQLDDIVRRLQSSRADGRRSPRLPGRGRHQWYAIADAITLGDRATARLTDAATDC